MKIRIGTSGWNYPDWKERFYPAKLSTKDWFNYYCRFFDTVEINNTFYQLPKSRVFKAWQKQAKKGFVYAVKANRFITHMKKLKACQGPLKRFFRHITLLKSSLGPVLYQLPPGWNVNLERFKGFLKTLPKGYTHVFEFRNNSWFRKEVFDLIAKYGVYFCIHDMTGINCPKVLTNKITYLRFHGTEPKYRGGYSHPSLRKWASWLRGKKFKQAYIYFNNDTDAHALRDALSLKKILKVK